MIDETDPLVRAARARFAGITAQFGDRLDAARRVAQDKLAQDPPVEPPKPQARRRAALEDPTDTSHFDVSWMIKR